ncbi:hypothetical protein J7K50_00695 [bacterium]|nr:hypothetical protein [bacterium]
MNSRRFLFIAFLTILLVFILVLQQACARKGVQSFAPGTYPDTTGLEGMEADGANFGGAGAGDEMGAPGDAAAPGGSDRPDTPPADDPIPDDDRYEPPHYDYDLTEWRRGAVADSIYFMVDNYTVKAGSTFNVHIFCYDNANALSNLNAIRISVDRNKAVARKLYAGDFFDGFDGFLILSPLSVQQPDFLDIGINWGLGTNREYSRTGIIATITFETIEPGQVTFDFVCFDGYTERTFYSDLDGNWFTFGTVGKDYDLNGTIESEITVQIQ